MLVDCPAGLDRGFRTAISGAQTALIVTQDEPVCRRDAERAHMLLKREGVDECRLLVNQMRWQMGSSATGRARELAEALEVPLLGVVPEDEAVAACNHGLIEEATLIDFLRGRPKALEVVLTGRDPSQHLLDAADYVTEMRKRKHPFDRGIAARRGVEF